MGLARGSKRSNGGCRLAFLGALVCLIFIGLHASTNNHVKKRHVKKGTTKKTAASKPSERCGIPGKHVDAGPLEATMRDWVGDDHCFRRTTEVVKTVWMFWHSYPDLGEGSYADFRRQCIEGWRRLNPGWQIRVVNMEEALQMAPRFAASFELPAHKKYCIQLQADLLRLELLNTYGGVWADTTTLPVRPLDSWIYDKLWPSGFWAFTGNNFKNVSAQPDHRKKNCFDVGMRKDRVIKCYAWKFNDYKRYNIALNWFIAASQPANPVIQAWLAVYDHHLGLINNRSHDANCQSPPYFLQQCSFLFLQQRFPAVAKLLARTPSNYSAELLQTAKLRGERSVNGEMLLYKRSGIKLDTYGAWLGREDSGPFRLGNAGDEQWERAMALWGGARPQSLARVPVLFLPSHEPNTVPADITGTPCTVATGSFDKDSGQNISPATRLIEAFRGGKFSYAYTGTSRAESGQVKLRDVQTFHIVEPQGNDPYRRAMDVSLACSAEACSAATTQTAADHATRPVPTLFAWTEPTAANSTVEVLVLSNDCQWQCKMHSVSGGFAVVINLAALEVYTYKFRVNGRWRFAHTQPYVPRYSKDPNMARYPNTVANILRLSE